MEALSVAANIIPIIATAAKVVKTLDKIARLRHTPPQLLQLLNEVSDFRIILITVQETALHLQEQDQDSILDHHLSGLISSAVQIISDIDEICKENLTRNLEKESLESALVAWKFWIKKHGNLQDLSKRLQQVRVNIATALTLVTATEIPRLRTSLRNFSMNYYQMDNDLNSLSTNIATIRPSIDFLQDMLQNMHLKRPANPTHTLLRSLKAPSNDASTTSNTVLRIQTAVERSCNSLCICHCHQVSHMTSPPWLKGLIGLLFITYNAEPLFGIHPCTEKLCRRNNNKILKVNYYFPTWLLSRMIHLRDQWTPRDSHAISIRTPRVIQDPIFFVPIMTNQLFQLQNMFARHETSPFDVDSCGTSALNRAVDHHRVEICQFLLNEHSDPHLEDQFCQSSIDYVFHHWLLAPDNPKVQAIYRMFLPFVDADELLKRKGFNLIHQIVLGLRSRPGLEELLEGSTVGIDEKDGRGWTPLFWAVRRSNLPAIDILLKFGASIEMLDPRGYNIFHTVLRATKDRISMLERLFSALANTKDSDISDGAEIARENICEDDTICRLLNHRAHDGMTPLSFAAYKSYLPECTLLLSHHASPDLGRPLTLSIQVNAHAITRLLLASGASTSIRDSENMTIVHSAACFGDLKTIRILKKASTEVGVCDIGGKELDKFGRTSWECFERVREGFRGNEEGRVERRLCRAAFLEFLVGLGCDEEVNGEEVDSGKIGFEEREIVSSDDEIEIFHDAVDFVEDPI